MDWLFSPGVVNAIGAVIDPSVQYVLTNWWAVFVVYWGMVFMLGVDVMSHPSNALNMADAVPVPDFLQQIDQDALQEAMQETSEPAQSGSRSGPCSGTSGASTP